MMALCWGCLRVWDQPHNCSFPSELNLNCSWHSILRLFFQNLCCNFLLDILWQNGHETVGHLLLRATFCNNVGTVIADVGCWYKFLEAIPWVAASLIQGRYLPLQRYTLLRKFQLPAAWWRACQRLMSNQTCLAGPWNQSSFCSCHR